MKKLLLFPLTFLALQLRAQTLFTFGNHSVSKQEFLHAFEKNSKLSSNDSDAIGNYLNLYINFKLKVQDAKDHRLDTLPALKADLQSFKNQIENNYAFDQSTLQSLLDQAITRSRKDIHVTATYVRGADTSRARSGALQARALLQKKNHPDFSTLQKAGFQITSEDLGYITVFTLPYDIENIVYGLGREQYSSPYYFDGGFYIFKNDSERNAAGKIKLAQILIASDPTDPASDNKAHHLADSLYHLLKDGSDFALLAKEYSNDRSTFMNGGEMPEMSVGKYSPEFEEQAFALKHDSDISVPFKTSFGYHILKRISASPVPQQFNEDFNYEIKQQLLQDDRVEAAKDALLQLAVKKTGFTDRRADTSDIFRVTDSSLISNKNIQSGKINDKTVLYSFNDGSRLTVADWDHYIRISGKITGGKLHESYNTLWPDFKRESILKNYKERLTTFDPDFAEQLREFSDGNMLFEMMQRKVWLKAANDSTALRKYYQEHQHQYVWKKSADAVIFSCNNETTAKQCAESLKNMNWRAVMKKYSIAVQADSGRFEFPQLPVAINAETTGVHNPVINRFDGTASFADIIRIYPEGTPRSFADARGLVTEDYQNLLERQWVAQLRKKYPVKINENTLKSIRKEFHK